LFITGAYASVEVAMPIITISRGSFYHGSSVAEKLAAKLGYSVLSRDEVVEELDEFHLPQIKLVRGLNDAFSVLDRFPHGKQRYKAAIRAKILEKFTEGNVVYHGLFGHHFVRDVSHVLKVRIIADTTSRVADEMAREKISEEKAHFVLKKDDEERRKWGLFLYGTDVMAQENYNLIIRIGHISEDEAVDIIIQASRSAAFQETDKSIAVLADVALEAQVERRLFDFPNATVSAKQGEVRITLKVPSSQEAIINERIGEMLEGVVGLKKYTLNLDPFY
jgi:cytidylate kinase